MLLSSVNFVAKPKASKYKDKSEKIVTNKNVLSKQASQESDVCDECKRESDEENSIFKFPSNTSSSSKSSGYFGSESQDYTSGHGDRVTIATSDDLCLTVDQFFYTIGLRNESKSDSTCIFRKKVLESKTLSNGCMETVVFALDCDQEFYITATNTASLELNYCVDSPSLERPDERQFVIHHTTLGHAFIQPKLLKNKYLHHIDEALSVQELNLNWRCPEEYFFHFSAVPEVVTRRKMDTPKVCTHKKEVLVDKSETNSNETCLKALERKCKSAMIPDMDQLKLSSQKKFKGERIFSNLFFGCFSARSRHIGTEV